MKLFTIFAILKVMERENKPLLTNDIGYMSKTCYTNTNRYLRYMEDIGLVVRLQSGDSKKNILFIPTKKGTQFYMFMRDSFSNGRDDPNDKA